MEGRINREMIHMAAVERCNEFDSYDFNKELNEEEKREMDNMFESAESQLADFQTREKVMEIYDDLIEDYSTLFEVEVEPEPDLPADQLFNVLNDEWLNEWHEDNTYLARQGGLIDADGNFPASIPQTPFEEHFNGKPEYEEEYWVPRLDEFLQAFEFVAGENYIEDFGNNDE